MKVFIISTYKGYFQLAQRICNFNFPAGFDDKACNASRFPFKSTAQRIIKKHKLNKFNAEIEKIEI